MNSPLRDGIPRCERCRHLLSGEKGGAGYRCEAYPAGIPVEIRLGYVVHNKPYKSDNGIMFEPMEDPDEFSHRLKRI